MSIPIIFLTSKDEEVDELLVKFEQMILWKTVHFLGKENKLKEWECNLEKNPILLT